MLAVDAASQITLANQVVAKRIGQLFFQPGDIAGLFLVARLDRVGRFLDRARNAIGGLMQMAPDKATVQQADGAWVDVTPGRIASLRRQGFNRLSLGVQDYDDDVQRAVNRVQPQAQTQAILDAARTHGYRSVNIDLIYGLPKQTMATMARTLNTVIAAAPDRIALYHYAHMPQLFKPQRLIPQADMPPPRCSWLTRSMPANKIGRASCRERV